MFHKQYLDPALQPAHLPIAARMRAAPRTVPSPGIITPATPGPRIPSPSSSSRTSPPPPPYRAIKTSPWCPLPTVTLPRCASPSRLTQSTPRHRRPRSSTRCSRSYRRGTAKSSVIRDRRTPLVHRNRLPGRRRRLALMPSKLQVIAAS